MSATAVLELFEKDERFAGFSPTSRELCAFAWVAGKPLRPGTVDVDAEILVIAELYVHHGAGAGEALARARSEPISDADLRGAVRFAASRFADDRLRPALLERGFRSARELPRSTAVDIARSLFTLPADGPDEQATIAVALEFQRDTELGPEFGPTLGGCCRCGSVVREGGPTIAVWYRVPGRRRPGSEERTPDRFEWRSFSPLVELGEYTDEATRERRRLRPPKIVEQAREGAHLLCSGCCGRARLKLIEWPAAPEEDDVELGAGGAVADREIDAGRGAPDLRRAGGRVPPAPDKDLGEELNELDREFDDIASGIRDQVADDRGAPVATAATVVSDVAPTATAGASLAAFLGIHDDVGVPPAERSTT
jgi:hypothetical protein